jgi:glycosyltransferase involved in cell wall biosynthesis
MIHSNSERRIVILTGNHVCHNPRAFKEAEALTEAGFAVEWLGAWFSPELAERDQELLAGRNWRYRPVTNWTVKSLTSGLARQRQRLRRRLGLQRFYYLGWENDGQLGYCTRELLAAARTLEASLYIAHSEPALWVGKELARSGKNVGVDMEDWFSEDLVPEAQRERPLKLLRSLERDFLKIGKHRSCTSAAMSDALAETYNCKPPKVIYNAFPLAERQSLDHKAKDRYDRQLPSIHWFSQTLARGRGLEDLFEALPKINSPAQLHLRGSISSENRKWIESSLPKDWRERVFLHPLVSNKELLSRIAEHDIGLALEPITPRNKNVTISNKIFQYLLAGLAVIASDTAGQREVARGADSAIWLYQAGDSLGLADNLNMLLRSPELLLASKRAALAAAETRFNWEKIAPALVRSVEAAVA